MSSSMNNTEVIKTMKSIDARLTRIETAIAGDDSHDILGYKQRVKEIEVWKHIVVTKKLPEIDQRIDKIYYYAAGIGATVAVIGTFLGQIIIKAMFG